MDGALIYSCNAGTAGLDWLERRGIPTVTIDEIQRGSLPGVNIDDRGGARAAAQHLLDLGHTRIGILALQDAELPGPPEDVTLASRSYPTEQRLLGWHDALDAAGVVPVIRLAPHQISESGLAAARELIETGVTAVLCFSDVFAQYVVHAATGLGLTVPDDLSLVGFDDNPLAETIRLTTVRQDVAEKGRAAVTALAAVLRGEDPGLAVLPTELVVRGSTAPPQSSASVLDNVQADARREDSPSS